jgi:hypothetical protein
METNLMIIYGIFDGIGEGIYQAIGDIIYGIFIRFLLIVLNLLNSLVQFVLAKYPDLLRKGLIIGNTFLAILIITLFVSFILLSINLIQAWFSEDYQQQAGRLRRVNCTLNSKGISNFLMALIQKDTQ